MLLCKIHRHLRCREIKFGRQTYFVGGIVVIIGQGVVTSKRLKLQSIPRVFHLNSSNTPPVGKTWHNVFLVPCSIHPASCCIAAILAAVVGLLAHSALRAQPLFRRVLTSVDQTVSASSFRTLIVGSCCNCLDLILRRTCAASLSVEPSLAGTRPIGMSHSPAASLSSACSCNWSSAILGCLQQLDFIHPRIVRTCSRPRLVTYSCMATRPQFQRPQSIRSRLCPQGPFLD